LKQSDDFVNEVKTWANRVLVSNVTNPGITRLVPACIYLVSRTRNTGISLLDVADACDVAPFHVGRWYRRLIDRLKIEPPTERTPALIVDDCVCKLINESTFVAKKTIKMVHSTKVLDPDDPITLISKEDSTQSEDWDDRDTYGDLGQLRQRVITAVQRIIKMASDQLLVSGRHPGPIAAAATHLVVKSSPDTSNYVNLNELLILTHTTTTTVEKRMSELKSLLLKAAQTTLPWASTITITNLEEKLPMIISHLEVEARITTARIKLEEQQTTEETSEAKSPHQ
jgi:transcription initiation factor TFIIIB Brf1 subunit/transcription initiation factor TFIIB